MTVSTSGVELRTRSRTVREAVELLSSMRFSISLLTLICIASIIGTVVKQNEPAINYVNQFGPFWADVFGRVNLFTVYSAPWFLLILAFLVVSTSLCIARNAPKILVDLKNYKESLREQALQAFHHKGQATLAETPATALARVSALLAGGGWKAKVQQREGGTMVAARKGSSNKIGYLSAHSSIVLICLGGLADGDLIVRAQMAWQGKTPFAGGGMVADVPDQHRLSSANPTFRANLLVPEGARAGTAILSMQEGVVLQDLPFDVELKKFVVEYYATGMPKLFASQIVIHDRETQQAIPATVEVNKPAFHRGIAIYQSSFDDGGSQVKLSAMPMRGNQKPFTVEGQIGGRTEIVTGSAQGDQALTLEFAALRVINVENFGAKGDDEATDVRKVDLRSSVEERLGSGTRVVTKKELRNVGPSITYKLRDASGQAREFHNYMLPFELDGHRVFLLGTRDAPSESFRYLRVPADDQDGIDGWMRLRQALDDPALRDKAVRRYVALSTPTDKPEMAAQLLATAERALGLFAGVDVVQPPSVAERPNRPAGGLQALADFMETSVPESDRMRITEVLLRILNGSLHELLSLTREQAGLAPLASDESTEQFMRMAVTSLSDSFFYPTPLTFQLTDFTQVQASVFQVARAPGQKLVYLGATLLILGVFMMLYVRERRLWIWLQADGENAERTRIVTAMSTTRRTLDGDAEFERIKKALLQETA
ncbi:MAG: cytochrome c biogenesis protein ResB [Rubrivivax sp.]|nr:cytochrome c biogenesis protein ResB [Rubrivivax sp.]